MDHKIWFIAWRTVIRQIRRFLTVILAVVVGIVLISLIQGILSGVNHNIYATAARYYGGNVLVMGTSSEPTHRDFARAKDCAALNILADSFGSKIKSRNFRISVNFQGTIFFDGASQQQKRINGINWESEASLLQGLDVLDHAQTAPDDDSVIISKSTSMRLKCTVGSPILLQLQRIGGQVDTIRLQIWGIYQDAAVFGPYNAYMSQHALNMVLGNDPEDFSTFALTVDDGIDRTIFAADFNQKMAKVLPTLPIMHSRNEYSEKKYDFTGTESHYSAMPVDFSVEQLNQLSGALASGLIILMLFISLTVATGTFNTYRIMLDERSRELGSMRAMGLSSIGLRNMILVEGLIIAVLACLGGLLVSMVLMHGLFYVPLGKIPGLDLFLNKGHLNPAVSSGQYALDLSVMILLLEVSAWMAARQVRNMSPLEAIIRR